MNLHVALLTAIAALAAAALPAIADTACEARSGPNTTALVELYTSEGCSSCPPADAQLSRLKQALGPTAKVVPLALHVGYWDHLGWTDPYAQARFAQRQAWLVHANQHGTVYTPQFFIGGAEARAWQVSLRDAVSHRNGMPAAATILLRTRLSDGNVLTFNVEATAHAGNEPTALYMAIAESGLVSRVMGGENGGATLTHDHVVREWVGPILLRGGTIRAHREIRLPASWNRDRLEMIAFVQDERTGSVLQAVRAGPCTGA